MKLFHHGDDRLFEIAVLHAGGATGAGAGHVRGLDGVVLSRAISAIASIPAATSALALRCCSVAWRSRRGRAPPRPPTRWPPRWPGDTLAKPRSGWLPDGRGPPGPPFAATDWQPRLEVTAVDLARRAGRLFGELGTSSATTAKPRRARRPGRLDGGVEASRLVCSAISRDLAGQRGDRGGDFRQSARPSFGHLPHGGPPRGPTSATSRCRVAAPSAERRRLSWGT